MIVRRCTRVTRLAMQRGTLETMRDSEQDEDDETAPNKLGDVVALSVSTSTRA